MWIFKQQRGAISLFLLLIFAALFMFAGLMVDLGRLFSAERKIENALETALRSVLAQYNVELVGQTGLYGLAWATKEAELQKYFQVNLVERSPGLSWLNYEIKEVELSSSLQKSLLNDAFFKEQIRQYMKYKGPLLAVENIADKFSEGAWQTKIDLWTLGGETSHDLKKIAASKKILNQEIKEVMTWTQGKAIEKIVSIERIKEGLSALNDLIQALQENTQVANQQLAEIKEQTAYLLATEKKADLISGAGFSSELSGEEIKRSLKDLEVDLVFNQGLWAEIATLEGEIANLAGDDLAGRLALNEKCALLYRQMRSLPALDFVLDSAKQNSLAAVEVKKKNDLGQSLKSLGGRTISEDDLIKATDLREANCEIGEKATNVFLTLDPARDLQKMSAENELAESVSQDLSGYLQQLQKSWQQAGQCGQERLYLTEYVLDKFTFVTTPLSRGHFFEHGEVEYILCGHQQEMSNISEVFLQIWSMRFALNALDLFVFNPVPSFSVRLGEALVGGFIYATRDLLDLYRGKTIPLCASLKELPLSLSYSDHLRLFLLGQTESRQLLRMRHLLQVNERQLQPDFQLKDLVAEITGRVEVAVNLWFVPLWQLDKLGFKAIQGQQFYWEKEQSLGY